MAIGLVLQLRSFFVEPHVRLVVEDSVSEGQRPRHTIRRQINPEQAVQASPELQWRRDDGCESQQKSQNCLSLTS